MTLAMPDLEELQLPEIPLPCEATWQIDNVVHNCDQAATWAVRTTCHCGYVGVDMLCDEHKKAAEEAHKQGSIRRLFLGPGWWAYVCVECGCYGRSTKIEAVPL